MMPCAGIASRPSVRRTSPATSTARTRAPAQLRRPSNGPAVAVEGDEVRRQARVLPIAGGEPRIVAERLGVGREQVRREREPSGQELVADLLGRDAEPERRPVASRVAFAASSPGCARARAAGRARRRPARKGPVPTTPSSDGRRRGAGPLRHDRPSACRRSRPGRRRRASRDRRRTRSARRCGSPRGRVVAPVDAPAARRGSARAATG